MTRLLTIFLAMWLYVLSYGQDTNYFYLDATLYLQTMGEEVCVDAGTPKCVGHVEPNYHYHATSTFISVNEHTGIITFKQDDQPAKKYVYQEREVNHGRVYGYTDYNYYVYDGIISCTIYTFTVDAYCEVVMITAMKKGKITQHIYLNNEQ